MSRVTRLILRNMVADISKNISTANRVVDLDISNGGYQLVIVRMDDHQSQTTLSRRLSAGEMYETLYTLKELINVVKYDEPTLKLVLKEVA